ncbi:hypothetical protein [Thermaurantiacus sp.]
MRILFPLPWSRWWPRRPLPRRPRSPRVKPGERQVDGCEYRGPGPDALRSSTPEKWAALRTARDRVNVLIAADRLDVPALRRAMEEERRLVDQQQVRRQAALLEAVAEAFGCRPQGLCRRCRRPGPDRRPGWRPARLALAGVGGERAVALRALLGKSLGKEEGQMMMGWRLGAMTLLLLAGPALAQAGRTTVADAFAGMSPEGRRIMSAAILGTRSEATREAMRAARERVLQLLEADTLDQRALGEAMRAEDDLLLTELNQRRQRMAAAYAQLSAADRKAYVAAIRAQRTLRPAAKLGARALQP